MIIIFLLLSVGIGAVGFVYYDYQKGRIRQEIQNELAAIGDLKVGQLVKWRKERIGDAQILVDIKPVASTVQQFFDNPGNTALRREILDWMTALKEQQGYKSIVLVDARGRPSLSTRDSGGFGHLASVHIEEARRTGKAILSDFHRSTKADYIHLDLVAPLKTRRAGASAYAGFFLFRIDPHEFLYPLIQSWPGPSRTSETLLVRREGAYVLFLNELRHKKNTSLSFKLPLSDNKLPAAMAALGREGIVEGIDYTGFPVLASLRAVPDSPWFLVSKIDAEEVYSPIRRQALLVTVIVGLMITAAGVVMGLLWRQQLVRFYRERYETERNFNEERARSEETLRESEEKFRKLSQEFNALLDAIPDSLTLQAPDHRILWANKSAMAAAGKDVTGIVGQYCYVLWHGSTASYEHCPVDRSLRTGRMENEIVSTPSGKLWDLRTVPIKDSSGKVTGVIELARDISEHRKLEDQLRQAQKMEAVGQLAGGIAHDFNNILTAIIGYANLLRMRISEDEPMRAYADLILSSSERAANLTQSLLAFSRKQVINPRPVLLNDIIRKVEKLLLRIIGEDIDFRTLLTGDEMTIMADPIQIEQVLMNLCANARDAMPAGGSLTVETGHVDLDEDSAKMYFPGRPGRYAVISVTDSGEGMDEKTRERIFEPFFTTKELDKGTGLGLAMVYGIVKQHNGHINVYSEPQKGTTFRIYLPVVMTGVEEAEELGAAPVRGGSETILVSEDDAVVRALTRTVLEQFGYHVIEAEDGEDAVRKFMDNKDRVDLLLLDLVMPKKNGREAYEDIRKVEPGIRVLFTSGYAADIINRKMIVENGFNFLSKPTPPRDLLRKVREVLDAAGPAA